MPLRRPLLLLLSVALLVFGWAQVNNAAKPRGKGPGAAELTRIEAEIAATNKLLAETRTRKQRSVAELRIMERKIELHRKLIAGLGDAIEATRHQIETQQVLLAAMESDLKQVNERYAVSVKKAYISQSQHIEWLSVLSAGDVRQAFYRLQSLRKLADFRRNQLELLRESHDYIGRHKSALDERLHTQQLLLARGDVEEARLKEALSLKGQVYQGAQQQEAQYLQSLNQQQQALQKAIEKIERQASAVPKAAAEQAATNGSFIKAKGKLMWPVSDGIMVTRYGRQIDKYGNQYDSHSIRIRSPRGEHVRAVFAGEVTGVTALPGRGQVVVVNHGGYRTSYAGLDLAYVKPGEKVAAGQPLGVVQTDARSGESILEFMLYDDKKSFADPERWLLPSAL